MFQSYNDVIAYCKSNNVNYRFGRLGELSLRSGNTRSYRLLDFPKLSAAIVVFTCPRELAEQLPDTYIVDTSKNSTPSTAKLDEKHSLLFHSEHVNYCIDYKYHKPDNNLDIEVSYSNFEYALNIIQRLDSSLIEVVVIYDVPFIEMICQLVGRLDYADSESCENSIITIDTSDLTSPDKDIVRDIIESYKCSKLNGDNDKFPLLLKSETLSELDNLFTTLRMLDCWDMIYVTFTTPNTYSDKSMISVQRAKLYEYLHEIKSV